jgi:hypothetical protein
MLYVLPPPTAPSPPSPWVSIRACNNNNNSNNNNINNKNKLNKDQTSGSVCVVKNSACHKVKMIVKSLDVMKSHHQKSNPISICRKKKVSV